MTPPTPAATAERNRPSAISGHRIHCVDCVEGMRSHLGEGCVDVAVTSPPYNIGVHYNAYEDRKERDDYLAWIEGVAADVKRVLAEQGSFFLNVGSKPTDPWIASDVARRVGEHFALQNTIHWVKSIAIAKEDVGESAQVAGDVAVGHYKPISSKRFLHDCHEFIFHFTKTGDVELDRLALGVPYQDKTNIGRWGVATEDLRCRGNTWFIPYETIQSRKEQRPHPATFPSKLPEMCVKLHGLSRTRLVMDPFMGIGSTAVACLRLGVDFIGFEIDPEYVEVAERRVCEWVTGK